MTRDSSAVARPGMEGDFDRLKKQFLLLSGDKRAFYENTQLEIQQNRELISRYRTENEQLRQKVSSINDSQGSNEKYCYAQFGTDALGDTSDLQQIPQPLFLVRKHEAHVRNVHLLREKADETKVKKRVKQEQLEALKRELQLLLKQKEKCSQSKKARDLENRIDKANLKYKEAQAIRKTYLKITDCLSKDRLTYDNQLAALEKALKDKRAQYAELEIMARDAIYAKKIAKDEQQKYETYFVEQKKRNEKELTTRKDLMQRSMDEHVWNDESTRQSKIPDETELTTELERQTEDQVKLRFSEINFKKLKNVTGASHIKHVISKISAQSDTQEHLLQIVEECKTKKLAVTQANEELQAELNNFKYTDDWRGISPKVVEELESKHQVVQAELKAKREQLRRYQEIMTKFTFGIEHLLGKVTFKNAFDLASQSIEAKKAEYEALEALPKLTPDEDKEMKRIKEIIRAGTQVMLYNEATPMVYDEELLEQKLNTVEEKLVRFHTKTEEALKSNDLTEIDVIKQLPKFNVRIKLDDSTEEADQDYEDTYAGTTDDVPSRENIKKMAAYVVETKQAKSKGGRGKRPGMD